MSKPYSDDLRIRAVSAVAGGMSRHQASKQFSVGVSSVIRWVQQHDQSGSVSPKAMGGSRGTRIEGADRDWLLQRIKSQRTSLWKNCGASWPSSAACWWATVRSGGSVIVRR